MNQQHTHNTIPFSKKNHSVILVCCGVHGPANVGSLFRICDAFGVQQLVFDSEIDLSSSRLRKTARSTFKSLSFITEMDIPHYLSEIKDKGYRTVGLEITSQSIPIQNFNKDASKPIALVIGGEQHGISDTILALLDDCVHIEMFGVNSSMNVAQAAAIALFEFTKT